MERNGPRVRACKRLLVNELNEHEAERIFNNAVELYEKMGSPDEISRQGLLFGQVQSGKTNNMLMSIALASDNGHRLFVILTSDNTWLYEQTLERTVQALPGLLTVGKDAWEVQASAPRIETALERSGLVIVATKNGNILDRMQRFIGDYCSTDLRAVILDDEADQASLNTLVNQNDDERSRVNDGIVRLREYFPSHVYVQVTATPQALFLQNADSGFAPEFTIMFEPGEGYVGGEDFFACEDRLSPMRTFPDAEVDSIISEEIDEEDIGLAVPTGLRQALCSFFVAAGVKLYNNEGLNFSCLCHISHLQDAHKRMEAFVNGFITRLTLALMGESAQEEKIVLRYLREAYNDIMLTHNSLPEFEDVCQEISDNIASTQIQVLISGRYYRRPVYNAPFNILIGGNRLGRGVTIKRLLVTYYGRTSRAPQIDTILQHARMYGYRRTDLDVMRFFTSETLLDLFNNIYESESQLRSAVDQGDATEMQAVVLSRTNHSILRPTRSSVIYLDSIVFYMPGIRYFPRFPLSENITMLDNILLHYDGRNEPTQVPIDMLIEIINLTEVELIEGETWDKEAVLACLRNMKDLYHNRGFLVVRTNRNISRGSRAMLSEGDYNIYNPSGPTLTMYKYNGRVEEGWDGNQRWVPNLRFPDGRRYFMFSAFS